MATIVANWLERLLPGCVVHCLHLQCGKQQLPCQMSKIWSRAVQWQKGDCEWEFPDLEFQLPLAKNFMAGLHLQKSEHLLVEEHLEPLRSALKECRSLSEVEGQSTAASLTPEPKATCPQKDARRKVATRHKLIRIKIGGKLAKAFRWKKASSENSVPASSLGTKPGQSQENALQEQSQESALQADDADATSTSDRTPRPMEMCQRLRGKDPKSDFPICFLNLTSAQQQIWSSTLGMADVDGTAQ